MTSNIGVWQPPDQKEQELAFDNVLKNVVRMSAVQRKRLKSQMIKAVSDLAQVDEATLLEVFPTTTGSKQFALKAIPKMRLKALRLWAIHKGNELYNLGIPINATEFTADVCSEVVGKLVSVDEYYKKIWVNSAFSLSSLDGDLKNSENLELRIEENSKTSENLEVQKEKVQTLYDNYMLVDTNNDSQLMHNREHNKTADGGVVMQVEFCDEISFSRLKNEKNLIPCTKGHCNGDGNSVLEVEYVQDMKLIERHEVKTLYHPNCTDNYNVETHLCSTTADNAKSACIFQSAEHLIDLASDVKYGIHDSDKQVNVSNTSVEQKLKNAEDISHQWAGLKSSPKAVPNATTNSVKLSAKAVNNPTNDSTKLPGINHANGVRQSSNQSFTLKPVALISAKENRMRLESNEREGNSNHIRCDNKHVSHSNSNQGMSKKMKSTSISSDMQRNNTSKNLMPVANATTKRKRLSYFSHENGVSIHANQSCTFRANAATCSIIDSRPRRKPWEGSLSKFL